MKNAEIKHWLRKANQQGCEDYIVIAIDKNHNMIASAEASIENMMEMLGSFAMQNPGFKEALMATAAYLIQKESKKEGEAEE